LATKGRVDGAGQEPSGKGREPDNQRERIVPHDAGHEASPSSAGSVTHDIAAGTPIEDQLRAQEAFYRNIIEGAADVTTLISSDGTILYASATISAPTSLGYTAQEVVGRNCLDLMHPDDREGTVRAIANAFAGLNPTLEGRFLRKDGSWIWVEMRGKAIVGLDGKPVVAVYSRDVTERKCLQAQLKKNEEYYKSLLRKSSDLILVTDLPGVVRFSSDCVQTLFGYRPDEVLGQQILSFVHGDDVAMAAEAMRTAAESSNLLTKLRVRRKDGTWCECESTGSVSTSPEGEPLLLINVRDVTARKAAERELTELATIVNTSDDAIIGFSRDFKISSWNSGAERAFGISASAAIGCGFDLFVPAEKLPLVIEAEKRVLDAGQTVTFEVAWPKQDGSLRTWSVDLFPLLDSGGKIMAGGSIGHDISERKRAERENALLAAVVESSEDAIISNSTDALITSWNRGAERVLGFTADEALGKNFIDLYVPPEMREPVRNMMREDLAAPGTPRISRRMESPAIRRDGVRIEVSLSVSGIYDGDGHLLGMSAIMRDITERKQIERENALLAAVVGSSGDGIVSYASDLRITSWNPGAERILGFTAEQAVGQSILDVYVPPRLREHARTVMSEVLEALVNQPKITRRLEVPVIRQDGVEIEAAIVVSGIYNRDGQMLGISAILSDLSERKQAEREQALLASIVASTDDAVISLGPDGRITSWNRGAEILLGFTAAEAIGQSGVRFMTPPATRDYADHEIGRQLEMAANQRLRERLEVQVQRKDQTLRDVSIVVSGIYNFSGARIGLSGIMRDITERKRAEREHAILASIVKASDDAIVAVDRQGRIVGWNPAASKIYGFSEQQALGHGLDLFIPPDELKRQLETDRRVLETGETASFEHHPRGQDDKSLTSLVNVFPIRDAAGNIAGVGGIARDITRSKQVEAELREAQEYTRGLIESSVDAMVIVGPDMRISDGNEQLARLTELPKKVLFGGRFDSHFSDPARARAAVEKALAEGYVTNVDLALKAASGKEIVVSFNASLFYRAGKVLGIFGVARDVTRRARDRA